MERTSSIMGFILPILYLMTIQLACNGDTHFDSLQFDREALIDFKRGLKDPNNRLSSWNESNYCHWEGITCENDTEVVISIDLHNPYSLEDAYENWSSMRLGGEIRPSLVKLKSLKYLDLSLNSFEDILIPSFFGSLKNLQYLNLSNAGFGGVISSSLGNLSNLQYLDISSNDFFVDNIEWMVGLVSLKHLDMNFVNLSLVGPQWVEILNKHPVLIELHLANCNLFGSIPTPSFLNFTSLAVITLSDNNFNSKFPEWLVNVSSLVSIDISYNTLHGRLPLGLGELPNLKYLDLYGNNDLRGSIFQLLKKSWKKIEVLNFGANNFHGSIPSSIGNFCQLRYLDLSSNHLDGNLPEAIKGLENCSSRSPLPDLMELRLNDNQLTGKLPNWLGGLENLVRLNLSNNKLEGPIPSSLGTLQHLEYMVLGGNQLNGSLPYSIGQLSLLNTLDVSSNHLTGTLSEQHFSKLRKLEDLNLNFNSFRLNVSSDWVPPFQANSIAMASCHVGPSFPAWIQSQKNLGIFDFANASISSYIPDWFWDVSFDLLDLTLSHNQLQGRLPDILTFSGVLYVNFSFNLLEGPIPLSAFGVGILDLSHNNFSGHIPLSQGESMSSLTSLTLSNNQITGPIPSNIGESMPNLYFISLSGNQITGTIPDSIGLLNGLQVIDFSRNNLTGSIPSTMNNCTDLTVLDLGNNGLSGTIPNNFHQLWRLKSLHLNHNKLSGEFPSSLKNLSRLVTLDLSYNNLSGKIPKWIGTGAAFTRLSILSLRSNAFTGGLPVQLANLSSLHVLDLAGNHLTGSIPPALGDLKAMAQEQNINREMLYGVTAGYYYQERFDVSSKSQILQYTTTLSLVVSIDLSNNKFSGEFPKEMTNLHGLVILNLSRNCITGSIPENISSLRQLSSLDLSNNRLSGVLPRSMSLLTFLGYLNLSNNNFSGMIPFIGQMTTFNASIFYGNPGLCGAPLVRKCGDNPGGKTANDDKDEDHNGFIDEWFYLSVGLGFAVGILGPFFVLALKRSWSEAYFSFVDEIVYNLGLERRRSWRRRRTHG
ncbi:hypothetical protein PVL29_012179 [Vitis rotundifolia]|uniref:Leucine-rich repeat-containing N-terminal plant-type domain-containing protein n=1 Tax=Vitis rotundifolia TaxID=103349 RepID=A0AA38ZS14_VITRO|nr:hypothetical protein PVL29_012179 [Vitis rotundifolia]